MQVTINYPTPKSLLLEADKRFARTEDGRFYARVSLGFVSSTGRQVEFHLYVQLSEADWTALREGKAEYVTGRIEGELPAVYSEYWEFEPSGLEFAGVADYCQELDSIFDALAEREVA